jgi:hypothetical protein
MPTLMSPPTVGFGADDDVVLAALAAKGTVEASRASATPAPTLFITRDRLVERWNM